MQEFYSSKEVAFVFPFSATENGSLSVECESRYMKEICSKPLSRSLIQHVWFIICARLAFSENMAEMDNVLIDFNMHPVTYPTYIQAWWMAPVPLLEWAPCSKWMMMLDYSYDQ